MPKRKHEDDEEDKWRRKLKKYEKKLRRKRRRREKSSSEYASEDDAVSPGPSYRLSASPASPDVEAESQASPPRDADIAAPRPPPPAPAPTPAPRASSALAAPAVTTPPALRGPVHASSNVIPSSGEEKSTLQPATGDAPAVTATEAASIPTEMSDNTPSADPELLQALGIFEAETTEWGRDILGDLAKRWEPLLKDGLKKETKEELLKKHLYPKNCPLIKPPILNPEIAAMLNESAKNRDSRILKKQGQLGCVLSILGKTMSDMLTKSKNTSEILCLLADAAKLLADSHFLETETRRSLVTPMVDKTFIEPFKNRKRDDNLFGEKLGDFIKSSRGLQKTGKLIQASSSNTANNLNGKNPPHRNQQQRSSRAQASRGGAHRAAGYRRRAPAHHATTRTSQAASPSSTQPNQQRHKPANNALSTKQK